MSNFKTGLLLFAPENIDFLSVESILKWLFGIRQEIEFKAKEISLRWIYTPENWLLVLIILAVFIFAFIIYRKEKTSAGGAIRFVLTMIRTIIILLIIFLLFGPVLTFEKAITKETQVIVLLDTSLSMDKINYLDTDKDIQTLADAMGIARDKIPQHIERLKKMKRYEILNEILKNTKVLEKIAEQFDVVCYTFSGKIKNRDLKTAASIEPDKEGTLTAIGDALKSALSLSEGHQVSDIIVFSDGRNNFGADPRIIAEKLGQRRAPVRIHTVMAGIPQPQKDLEITEYEVPKKVLMNDLIKIKAKVKTTGFEDKTLKFMVYLVPKKHAEEILEAEYTQTVKIIEKKIEAIEPIYTTHLSTGKEIIQTVEFDYMFKEKGDYELIFKVEPDRAELNEKNNYAVVSISVLDRKMNVLFVDSWPRWEYRYLRNALVRDKTLNAWTLLISASPDYPQDCTPGLKPLEEFPADMHRLKEFDVVIIGDVHPDSLAIPSKVDREKAWENIKKFVAELGGGIILLAGEYYNPTAVKYSPLKDLLPFNKFTLPSKEELSEGVSYTYRVNPHEISHPAVVLEPQVSAEKNLQIWEKQLRDLFFIVKVDDLKPGATTIVYAKNVQTGIEYPLFIWMRYGRGFVFYSCTDETWRWRMYVGDKYFYTFWRQVMDWARLGKAQPGRFEIKTDKDTYYLGEQIKIFVKAYSLDYSPAENPPEAFVKIKDKETPVVLNKRPEKGFFDATLTANTTGIYIIRAGEADEWASIACRVVMPNQEEDDFSFDPQLLTDIAKLSGGKFFTISELPKLPQSLHKSSELIIQIEEDELWDAPFIFILFALLITGEWVIRKICRLM